MSFLNFLKRIIIIWPKPKPPAPQMFTAAMTVRDEHGGALLVHGTLAFDLTTHTGAQVDQRLNFILPVQRRNTTATLTVCADGYKDHVERVVVRNEMDEVHMVPVRQEAITLAPLERPVCHSCNGPYSYNQDLLAVFPDGIPNHPYFMNANFYGVPVPGLPFVPGASSENPEWCLTPFLFKYPVEFWQSIFDEHLKRGHNRFPLWWPSARDEGGMSEDDFAKMCKKVQQAGIPTQIGLNSSNFDPQDMTLDEWKARLQPLYDALGAINAADEYRVWEWDEHNNPVLSADILKWMGQQAHAQQSPLLGTRCGFFYHGSPGNVWWGDTNRDDWWRELGEDVDGVDYQCDPTWDIGEMQSRAVDTLSHFDAAGNVHLFRAAETTAMREFYNRPPITEEESCAIGFMLLCTVCGNAKIMGVGDGGRGMDGRPLIAGYKP